MRVDEAALGVPHLDEAELRDVARDGRLHGVDAVRAQRLGDLGLRRERLLLHEPQDRALPLELRRGHAEHLAEELRGRRSPRRRVSVSGGVSRSVRSPALPITSPCSSAASTTGPGRPVELDREQQAEPAHLAEAGEARGEQRRELADVRRAARRRSCRRRRTPLRTRPGCRRTSRRGRRARSRSARRRRRAARRSAARSRGPSRASPRRAARRAAATRRTRRVRPTPVCTSSRISSAPCSSASARACCSTSGASG